MTLITYNKGRDWEPLAPPTTDMNGKPVSCKQVNIPVIHHSSFHSNFQMVFSIYMYLSVLN